MEFFRCEVPAPGLPPYLMADYSQECYTGSWWNNLFIVVGVLLFFSIGTPIYIARTLYTRREELYDDHGIPMDKKLDILYAVYRKKAYYYESINMTFKLGLWSALVFFEHGSEAQ